MRRYWSVLVAATVALGCERREELSAQASSARSAASSASKSEPVPERASEPAKPDAGACDTACREGRRTAELELGAALLRAALRRPADANVRFSPRVLLESLVEQGTQRPEIARFITTALGATSFPLLEQGVSDAGAAQGAPEGSRVVVEPGEVPAITARFDLSTGLLLYPRRFIGIDGSTARAGLIYTERTVAGAALPSPAGAFKVFEFPLTSPGYSLRVAVLPGASAQRLATVVDRRLLQRILEIQLEGDHWCDFAQPPTSGSAELTPLLESAFSGAPPELGAIRFAQSISFSFQYRGGVSGVLRRRPQDRAGRPVWFLVEDRESSELVLVVALHSAQDGGL